MVSNENEIKALIKEASELERTAKDKRKLAQERCNHTLENGELAVSGFWISPGEEECCICGLEGCYIPAYIKKARKK